MIDLPGKDIARHVVGVVCFVVVKEKEDLHVLSKKSWQRHLVNNVNQRYHEVEFQVS